MSMQGRLLGGPIAAVFPMGSSLAQQAHTDSGPILGVRVIVWIHGA
jgi:hypothetical protein